MRMQNRVDPDQAKMRAAFQLQYQGIEYVSWYQIRQNPHIVHGSHVLMPAKC